MVNVKTEIQIGLPLEKVFRYSANPDNAPEWYVNIKSVEWQTLKPLTVGSQIAFKAQFLGRQLAYIYKIIELIPERKLVMSTSEGSFPMETIYTWKSIDDGTTNMKLENKGAPVGFSKLLTPFMAAAIKKANGKDLNKLKGILENQK
jgi:uncharacterized membrane protein